jgi:competence protein ComEC
VGVSAACGLVTAPILWLQFGQVPLWTVPANALAEPAMPVLLGCGIASAALAPVVPSAAVALSWISGLAAAWIALVARLFASLPFAQVSSGRALGVVALALLCGGGLAALPAYRRRAALVAVAALPPLLLLGWWALHQPPRWSPPAGLRLSMLDVGQGDGILIETPEGAMLVDAGPPEARVDRQLRRMGLHTLAAVVVTHGHRDHVSPGRGPTSWRCAGRRCGSACPSSRPGEGTTTRSAGSASASSGRTAPARPARTRTCTASCCSRPTDRSTSSSRATPSRR